MITLTSANNSVDLDDVSDSQLFHDWERKAEKLGNAAVEIHKVYKWGEPADVQMIQMTVRQNKYQYATLLRGQTVDMVTILNDGQDDYMVIAKQSRLPAGQLVTSNPSGMVDAGETGEVSALREASEELGITFDWQPAVNLNQHVLGDPRPLLVTPGGSDEAVTFFLLKARATKDELNRLRRHIGGLRSEGESIRLNLVRVSFPVMSLASCFQPVRGFADLKAITALLLYDKYLQYEAREE